MNTCIIRKIKKLEFDFIKTYLHAVYTKIIDEKDFTIFHLGGLQSYSNPGIGEILITSQNEKGFADIRNDCIYAITSYKGNEYHVSASLGFDHDGRRTFYEYSLHVFGTNQNSVRSEDLCNFILNESLKNCPFKNKLLKVSFNVEGDYSIKEFSINELKHESLEKVFLDARLKFELEKFSKIVDNFDKIGRGLRLLFSGEPGTGKTKSVISLIHKCYKKATIFIAEGDILFRSLFELANSFSPSIICLDDVDLSLSEREISGGNRLGEFLNTLDGVTKNNVFILATTNDKALVDKAAKRPGRFDMIIDFGRLGAKSYLDLIKDNCANLKIVELFDEEILSLLKNRKVTGAFIVNLLKQIEFQCWFDNEINLKEYLITLIDLSYNGFYKKTNDLVHEFGFHNNSI